MSYVPDRNLFCAKCNKWERHRWQPAPEAGPFWRCSDCGEACDAARPPSAALPTTEDLRPYFWPVALILLALLFTAWMLVGI